MGWGSGGDIFDPVARELAKTDVTDMVLDRVCYQLALQLMEGDWDTYDSSIDKFKGYPVIQHAIRKAAAWLELVTEDGDVLGRLEYRVPDEKASDGSWALFDALNGEVEVRPGTVAGFNSLIVVWATNFAQISDADRYLLV